MPIVSAIVPLRDDDDALAAALLAQMPVDARLEVIVAPPPPLGRGPQMNAGAARARGEWLLFLHADSRLPAGWLDAVERAIRDPALAGGWFRFALDSDAWQARVIERLVRTRVRLFRLPYGDQGLFVRRDVFARLGGFQEWPLMEDVEFVRRLVRSGPVIELPLPLATSARRWARDGWFRRSARNLAVLGLYFLGVPPARLATVYEKRERRS